MIQTAERRYHHPLQKDTATFLRTSEETGGQYTLVEVEVAPGGGTDLHRHLTYAERFQVLDGALTVEVGGETRTLRSGDSATAPPRSLHRFFNATPAPVRFLVELSPGSPGFEKSLMAAYGLANDGLVCASGMPRSIYHLAVILDWGDIRLPGAFTVAEPVLRFLAKRARQRGIDRALERKYCR